MIKNDQISFLLYFSNDIKSHRPGGVIELLIQGRQMKIHENYHQRNT